MQYPGGAEQWVSSGGAGLDGFVGGADHGALVTADSHDRLLAGVRQLAAGADRFAADGLTGLLHPAWQALIAICLLVVTLLGIRRLVVRGPARVTSAVLFTGFLIVAITVVGTLAVSCSGEDGQPSTSEVRPPSP